MQRGNWWVFAAGAVIIGLGVWLGLVQDLPVGAAPPLDAFLEHPETGPNQPASPGITSPKNRPVVVGFLGDLADGGQIQNDGMQFPFVIGDILELQAETLNATEYRWTVNGEVLADDGLEWSARSTREYEVTTGGDLRFGLQVRGADVRVVSPLKEKTITTAVLWIDSFIRDYTVEEDRALTGEEYAVEVLMVEPLTGGPDFYQFRYRVNDEIIPDEEGAEWTGESYFSYVFPAPGLYSFKVEVRRATEPEPEAARDLAGFVKVADAVLLSFDAEPEKHAPVGSAVNLDAFPHSLGGRSECRFGVKKVLEADYIWLPDASGAQWGMPERTWTPMAPGNYLLRAELRRTGEEETDDVREILYTISEGEF